jgi:inward rectifier potassium channel
MATFRSANTYGGRFINKDGTFNLRREGLSVLDRFSVFQSMLSLPNWQFVMLIFIVYFIINILFTAGYYIIGFNQLQGMIGQTPWAQLKEAFFFSTQTFVTVGYGRVNPIGDAASLLAGVESLTGLLSFAIITGLIYGRFSRPKSYLVFSDNAVVAPYQDKTALMFRFVNYKDNHVLTNVEIKVSLALILEENGKAAYKFYELPLERQRVDMLSMNWTVVHPIDESSPLMGYNYDDMKNADAEVYVLITGFDDVYASPVLQRTSYTYHEMKFNAKFVPMYRESEDGKMTIVELHKLNAVKQLDAVPV